MRILFIGGTLRGYVSLKALVETGAEIAGVIALEQDEHEVQRYEKPIQDLAQSHGIPHHLTRWMKDRDYRRWLLEEIRPDIAFVVGSRILIPSEIYCLPRLGTLAVHDSLLPRYRGFAPLNWSILNGEKETGVTLFYLDERMDGGDIVSQKSVAIGPEDTAPMVYERVCHATVDLLLEAIPSLVAGTASRTPQDYAAGSFTCSRTPEDGQISWQRPAREIFNQIRALTWPYPGAFTFCENRKLTVWQATPVEDASHYAGRIPGRPVAISKSAGTVDVLTGDGILRILEVQYAGEEKTAAAVAIRSIRTTLGLNCSDLLARITELEDSLRKGRQDG